MKKHIFLVAAILLSVLQLSACVGWGFERNEFFTEATLRENLIPEMPQPIYRYAKKLNEHSFEWTMYDERFDAYLTSVYEYLQSCDFTYFGYCNFNSGAEHSATFDVFPSGSLSDHLCKDRENTYVFAWANELDENNLLKNSLWIEYNAGREYPYSMYFGSDLDSYRWAG